MNFKHRASVSGPPSGAQAGLYMLKMAYELYVKVRADKVEEHPMFCFEPAGAPSDSYRALPASPPRGADV